MPRPPGVCEGCWLNREDRWTSDLALYCPHTRNLVFRNSRHSAWTVKRKVSPDVAQRHFASAVSAARAHGLRLGIEPAQFDAFMESVREREIAELQTYSGAGDSV